MTTTGPDNPEIISVCIAPKVVFAVGRDKCTRIESCKKSGSYADIPYVRVWHGDEPYAEFCQHNIIGVYFRTASS